MSHWNHRVIEAQEGDVAILAIHEVHYDDDGALIGYTKHPVSVDGESLEELGVMLAQMSLALTKPVLKRSDLHRIEPDAVAAPREEEAMLG